MRRMFSFGKVAYNGKRKINEVTLEVELRDRDGHPEFTARAYVWNNIHTNMVAGGQMIDKLYNEFATLRDSVLYKTIMQLWEKYHLHNISGIPAEDKELIDLLFSNKGRKEIEGILESRGGRRMTDGQKTEEDKQRLIEHLKEQIEKMKCCENCRHYSHTYGHCYSYDSYQNCKSLSNWSLADC